MDGITNSIENLDVNSKPVYLLKTKSSPTDSYEEHFSHQQNGNYAPIFVPVLEHRFRDTPLRHLKRATERFAFAGGSPATARQKATHNPARKYSGIIFTSQRAVDAFATVVAKLDPAKLAMYFDAEMPLYVVGPATAKGVRALGLPCRVVGEETGTGENLAGRILEDRREEVGREGKVTEGRVLPLLFLVGEQRRDVIPRTLQSEGLAEEERVRVEEVVVYETGEMASFEEEFSDLLGEARRKGVREQWVVVFSPQGCEAMLNALGWLGEGGKFSAAKREAVNGELVTKIATIGPTTRDYLMQEFDFEPDVCAEKPSPEGVAEAISKS
ncbi:hypothetical protein MBLNU230_g0763t1 [Neophaeotheca triangularis]